MSTYRPVVRWAMMIWGSWRRVLKNAPSEM
jgi:hypothetical protein